MAEAGGNAVDAAIAAMLVAVNTEPGVCSLSGGGYMTIRSPGAPPITLDGYVAVPGKSGERPASERVAVPVHLEYGGGVDTIVGPDSIGVPGTVALFGVASRQYGRLPWRELFAPVIDATRLGFPLPMASYLYLIHSGEPIFSRTADGHQALYHADGNLKSTGDKVIVPHLADSLEQLAAGGPAEFYTGELGRYIAHHVIDSGGRLGEADLEAYQVVPRPSLVSRIADWEIATNPPPAVGGAVLSAMLQLMGRARPTRWDKPALQHLVDVQRAVLGYRRARLDLSNDIVADTKQLLGDALDGNLAAILESGSTCHVSTVDADGLACSVTTSAGYGAGEMPPGTGLWLNNSLGELELNKRGLEPGEPGMRLPSNMAPTTAVSDSGEVLSIGSPGADRITTAILQVLINHLQLGMPIREAIVAPRAHVEFIEDEFRVACEAALGIDQLDVPRRDFPDLSMFFGGVGVASWMPGRGFAAAADPRRTGGTWSTEL